MTVRSNNAQLQAIFDRRVEEVRSKEFPYKPLRPARSDWARYNAAQENEFPEVIGMIGTFIGKASEAFRPPPRYDAMGREPYSMCKVARLVLAQQYDGRCNRVSIGLLTMFKLQLGTRGLFHPTYKTLERAYEDPDVISLLNEAFFLTQLPVKDLEHDFSFDGTCHPTTIKENWESSKDEILRLTEASAPASRRGRGGVSSRRRSWRWERCSRSSPPLARTKSSFSNDSPYLKPLYTVSSVFE
jgi:hypothetical protein